LLSICEVTKAFNFDEAKDQLATQFFDIATLYIMGVDNFKFLGIAKEKNVILVILTAHALSVDDTVKTYKEEVASHVPKDEMVKAKTFFE
jgi:hypothetical protein